MACKGVGLFELQAVLDVTDWTRIENCLRADGTISPEVLRSRPHYVFGYLHT